jgi:hypothetical protein
MVVSPAEAQCARRLAAAAGGELEIWDVTAESARLGGWARRLCPREATAKDALMAFDGDLMIRDGWPHGTAEHMALRHAKERALLEVQADLEAG